MDLNRQSQIFAVDQHQNFNIQCLPQDKAGRHQQLQQLELQSQLNIEVHSYKAKSDSLSISGRLQQTYSQATPNNKHKPQHYEQKEEQLTNISIQSSSILTPLKIPSKLFVPTHKLWQLCSTPNPHEIYLHIYYRTIIYVRKEEHQRTILDDAILLQELAPHISIQMCTNPWALTDVGERLLKNGYVLVGYSILMGRLHSSVDICYYLLGIFEQFWDVQGNLEEFLGYCRAIGSCQLGIKKVHENIGNRRKFRKFDSTQYRQQATQNITEINDKKEQKRPQQIQIYKIRTMSKPNRARQTQPKSYIQKQKFSLTYKHRLIQRQRQVEHSIQMMHQFKRVYKDDNSLGTEFQEEQEELML